eukprot:TRINITY_DN2609_c0_g1_i3.p1 TRINITY_DN2609_c0_g1~~TRINITY_DN2609_c0_g1_i3.p1  ORF type:complete len:855 (-),score=194.27 TRINITY_DN2609_c0_g1_i3:94-2658(-)
MARIPRYEYVPILILAILYVGANVAVFLERFFYYYNYDAVFNLLGYSVCFSRAFAAVIKLNAALILLTVCRNLLTWIRSIGRNWDRLRIPVDLNLTFHKIIAGVIFASAIGHIVSHFVNFHGLSRATVAELQVLPRNVPDSPPSIAYSAFATIPGITGWIMLIVLITMFSFAHKRVRKTHFERFFYTHWLFSIFIVVLCFHAVGGKLEAPSAVYWVAGPILIYVAEKLTRFRRGKRKIQIVAAIQHPGKVMELRLEKPNGFDYHPGQYLFLRCKAVSRSEWHPFSFTSAPEEDFVSVHINELGNWTHTLHKRLNHENKIGRINVPPTIKIRYDGPFGSSAEEVFKYDVLFLIGASIGITPFASVLKHIMAHNIARRNTVDEVQGNPATGGVAALKKIYFCWACRHRNAFLWFMEVLREIEDDCCHDELIDIDVYLTGKNAAEGEHAIKPDEESRAHLGRAPSRRRSEMQLVQRTGSNVAHEHPSTTADGQRRDSNTSDSNNNNNNNSKGKSPDLERGDRRLSRGGGGGSTVGDVAEQHKEGETSHDHDHDHPHPHPGSPTISSHHPSPHVSPHVTRRMLGDQGRKMSGWQLEHQMMMEERLYERLHRQESALNKSSSNIPNLQKSQQLSPPSQPRAAGEGESEKKIQQEGKRDNEGGKNDEGEGSEKKKDDVKAEGESSSEKKKEEEEGQGKAEGSEKKKEGGDGEKKDGQQRGEKNEPEVKMNLEEKIAAPWADRSDITAADSLGPALSQPETMMSPRAAARCNKHDHNHDHHDHENTEDDVDRDPVTGLRAKTKYGRPKWAELMARIAKEQPGRKVGVFFCGPPPMGREIREACGKAKFTPKTKFYFHTEKF